MKWIRVEERLPEEDKEVIVCDLANDVFSSELVLSVPLWDRNGEVSYRGPGWLLNEETGCYLEFSKVTHWMPLPEPPERNEVG